MTPRLPSAVAEPPGPPIAWDETPCPLCGADDAEPVLEAADPTPAAGTDARWFAVVRCRTCTLRYTNPRPDPETIVGFYPADYKPHTKRDAKPVRKPTWWDAVSGRSCPERRGAIPWHGRGRLLDFGCGGGSFLQRMAFQGWTVTGIDTSADAVRTVRTDLRLTALEGSLPHPDLEPGSFDVVTMWHSLEHVHEPAEVLAAAYQLLAPGGKLIVAVPNADGWAARRFGADWFALDLPRHLIHFTPPTLSDMLTAAGFRVDRVRPVRHADWLRSSAKRAVANGSRAMWHRPLTWKPAAKFASWVLYVLRASDCMLAVAERPG